MSSPLPYTAPQSNTDYPTARWHSVYRQIDYHDGNGVQIVESRRRSPVTLPTKSTEKDQDRHPKPTESHFHSPSGCQNASSQRSSLRWGSFTSQAKHIGHVTPRSSPRSKAQVVIVQGPVSVAVDLGKRDVAIDLTTPPPTPKVGRLATPELDDLGERPFCDCCTAEQVVRYCAACGCELKR